MDIFVVDTSALIRDVDLLERIKHGEIVIHTTVVEELDKLGKRSDSVGAFARRIGSHLCKIKNTGNFLEGISIRNKIIRIDDTKPDTEKYLRFGFNPKNQDNLLLCVAKEIQDKTGRQVILLTGDKFFSLKASVDIEIKMIKTRGHRKKEGKNKGYRNAQNQNKRV